jgi:hypothetical protein
MEWFISCKFKSCHLYIFIVTMIASSFWYIII